MTDGKQEPLSAEERNFLRAWIDNDQATLANYEWTQDEADALTERLLAEHAALRAEVERLTGERDAALEAGATDVAAAARMRIERDEARAQLAEARREVERLRSECGSAIHATGGGVRRLVEGALEASRRRLLVPPAPSTGEKP